MTVHVMAPPDSQNMAPDESLCTQGIPTEVVFHVHCRPLLPCEGFVCLDCGTNSGVQGAQS
jgi:hypothetical protein